MCEQASPVVIGAPPPQHRNITDRHLYSGTTGDPATNRTAPATAAADPSYTPAICQHGHDSSYPTSCTRRWLSHTAADATELPIPQPDAATATDEPPDGCPYTTFITSP